MTAGLLLVYICGAFSLQIVLGIGIAVLRLRRVQAPVSGVGLQSGEAIPKGAWKGIREFRITRREYEDPARTQCSFYLAPIDGLSLPAFEPGQFLTISLRTLETGTRDASAGAAITRCYSISQGPEDKTYRITVKRALAPQDRPEALPGVVSNFLLDKMHVGDTVKLRAPAGKFCLEPDLSLPTVFVAGGIGIAPIMSMLNRSLTREPARKLYLYYGVLNSSNHAFKAVLEQWASAYKNFQLHVVYSHPAAGEMKGRDYQHVGFPDVGLFRATLPLGRHCFYVCGPPAMMSAVIPALGSWGVLPTDIRTESFGPSSFLPTATSAAATLNQPKLPIQFSRSGRTLTWDGSSANLLDFAEKNNIVVEAGCRTGSCGICETRLQSGKVGYRSKPEFDVQPGHCLMCIAVPEAALVLGA